jgi:uncharacterized membrane protein SpoIIM required for sporulation
VDIDRYMLEHQPTWDRLDSLTKRSSRGVHRLGPGELDELLRLYQTTSGHLSYVRTYFRDGPLVVRLTALVAAASAVIYGRRGRAVDAIIGFFGTSFPAAVWGSRRAMGWSAALFLLPAVAMALWLLTSPVAMEESATAAERETYVEDQFEQYYSDQPAPQFATQVTVNNIGVSFLAFGLAAAGCVFGALVLVVNGAMLGQAAAWMIDAGDSLRFWGLILPHGLLEISAIVIAGAAGLRLGWTLIVPGDRTRGEAAAEEGRRAVVIVLGLMAVFVTAGLIEGFVTGSGLPAAFRVGVGVAVETAFVVYVVVLGRSAEDRGYTGALGELAPGRDPSVDLRVPLPVAVPTGVPQP